MIYNWQQPDWPDFKYAIHEIENLLFAFAEETAHVSGMLKAMPDDLQMEAVINIMVAEAMKTSEIEGEYFSREDVLSSVRNNFGLNKKPDRVRDKKAEGAGKLMVEVRKTFANPLTEQKLFSWHKILMSQNRRIIVGGWRRHAEPMQVISGAIGKEKIHFEAPPSKRIKAEMKGFVKWFNDTAPGGRKEIRSAPVRAAMAHLYFESIHPFEDGNGRIGRAIAEKALSQSLGRPVLLSLSQAIEKNKKAYYAALETAQRKNEITAWVTYFVKTILDAQLQAKASLEFTLKKTRFFDRFKNELNERQLKAVRKMLVDPGGFKGGMTAKKYISITRASKATATRDLHMLAEIGVLSVAGGGRSTHYIINLP